MYRAGRTVVPVWPTWWSLPMKPEVDRRAAGADGAAEAVRQVVDQLEVLLAADAAPPATITRAAFRFTFFARRCDFEHASAAGLKPSRSTCSADHLALARGRPAAASRITPSRTVAICGQRS